MPTCFGDCKHYNFVGNPRRCGAPSTSALPAAPVHTKPIIIVKLARASTPLPPSPHPLIR